MKSNTSVELSEIRLPNDDGRTYIWLEETKMWVDISPKTRQLVTFIKVGENNE